MGREGKEIKCPWCGEVIPSSEVQVESHENDYGTVVERRCTKCSKVLAAYLKEEEDFFSKIRTFKNFESC